MKRERVQMLRDMMWGIPEQKVNLNGEFNGTGSPDKPPKPCGALACMAGWAWIYPPFIKDGIREDGHSVLRSAYNYFGVHGGSCAGLFAMRRHYESGTDKEVALARLDALLATP